MNHQYRLTLIATAVIALSTPLMTWPQEVSREASPTTLSVTVSGLHSTQGQLLLWVWNGPEEFPRDDRKRFRFVTVDANTAISGAVTVAFQVPPGTYAVTALHDENGNGNGNGKMDTNFLGVPTEGLGTSNNVVTHFHAPSFDQVSFQVPQSGKAIPISMRY